MDLIFSEKKKSTHQYRSETDPNKRRFVSRCVCSCNFIRMKFLTVHFSRTLTYCIWNLMVGDDQPELKADRVALPPPTKRRDYHLRE